MNNFSNRWYMHTMQQERGAKLMKRHHVVALPFFPSGSPWRQPPQGHE